MLRNLTLVALAGAAGTLARYGLAGLVHRIGGTSFPWGTVTVNTIGCFLAGMLWTLCEHRLEISSETRTILFIGFLGAFTTFSTLILETGMLVRSSEFAYATANVFGQLGCGFVAFLAGVALARLI